MYIYLFRAAIFKLLLFQSNYLYIKMQHISRYRPILTVQSCSLVAECHIMLEHTPTFCTRYFPPFHPHVLELIRIPACPQDLHQICATSHTLYSLNVVFSTD